MIKTFTVIPVVNKMSWKPIFRVHSDLRFIRCKLLSELFSPGNGENLVHNPLLNFLVDGKVDQIAREHMTA